MTDKRDTVDAFRTNLTALIARTGLSRSKFAARAGLDRSTLTQLLAPDNVRLPRADTIARIASRHSVSVDWLLGLSQRDQVAADVVAQLAIESDAGSHLDERLQRWHEEARGYKVRYVPSSFPDPLKTPEVMAYESGELEAEAARAWREATQARIAHAALPDSEIEVCSSWQSLDDFADGHGIWRDLDRDIRHAQLVHAADYCERHYPLFRWFVFDGRQRFSVPYTVFGLKRAAIYVGDMYFVLSATEHIRELTRHFGNLIRDAVVQPHEVHRHLRRLAERV